MRSAPRGRAAVAAAGTLPARSHAADAAHAGRAVRALAPPAAGAAPPLVRDVVRAPGRPLPAGERRFMEARFARDFSQVRVHDDAPAALSAVAVGAEAYTLGHDVVFAPGRYAPHTLGGRRLLAHELAHVPARPRGTPPGTPRVGAAHDAAEAVAERRAESALAGRAAEHAAAPADDGVVRRKSCSIGQALGRGAGYGALGAGLAGGLIGLAIGATAGPLGALIGLGLGLLIGGAVGALGGLAVGGLSYASERSERATSAPRTAGVGGGGALSGPTHLETRAATPLVADPAAAAAQPERTLPAGTRVVIVDAGANAVFNAGGGDWVRVRVTTGPDLNAVGWLHRAALESRPETAEVSPAGAVRLFREMAAATFQTDAGAQSPVPYHYPIDGCYFRAQRMSQLLTEKGYASERVFAVANFDPECAENLRVRSPYARDRDAPFVRWWYHVAPIIKVRLPERGLIDMVLDPSLADGPLTVDEWTGRMSPEPFERLTLDDLRRLVRENEGRYPIDRRFTFVANRYTYDPNMVINPADPAAAEAAFQRDRARLTRYAERAEVHELAAALRDLLSRDPLDVEAVLAAVRAGTPRARREFRTDFPRLHALLLRRLAPADQGRLGAALNQP